MYLEVRVTYDRHRKESVREEAERRGLPYQTVHLEHRRRREEPGVRRRLTEVATKAVSGWQDGNGTLPHDFVATLVAGLVALAIPRPFVEAEQPAPKYRVARPPGECDRDRATKACLRCIAEVFGTSNVVFDDQGGHIKDLAHAVIPIVVEHLGSSATQARRIDRLADALDDYPELDHLCDSDE